MLWSSVRCPSLRPASTFSFKRLLLKKPLRQFQPKFVGNMLGGWGFRFVQIMGLAPFGSSKGENKGNFDKSSEMFFWPECIDKAPRVMYGLTPRAYKRNNQNSKDKAIT